MRWKNSVQEREREKNEHYATTSQTLNTRCGFWLPIFYSVFLWWCWVTLDNNKYYPHSLAEWHWFTLGFSHRMQIFDAHFFHRTNSSSTTTTTTNNNVSQIEANLKWVLINDIDKLFLVMRWPNHSPMMVYVDIVVPVSLKNFFVCSYSVLGENLTGFHDAEPSNCLYEHVG